MSHDRRSLTCRANALPAAQDPNARNCHGYRKFVKRSVLESPNNGYLVADTIVIRYTIELVVSTGGALTRQAPAGPKLPVIEVRGMQGLFCCPRTCLLAGPPESPDHVALCLCTATEQRARALLHAHCSCSSVADKSRGRGSCMVAEELSWLVHRLCMQAAHPATSSEQVQWSKGVHVRAGAGVEPGR